MGYQSIPNWKRPYMKFSFERWIGPRIEHYRELITTYERMLRDEKEEGAREGLRSLIAGFYESLDNIVHNTDEGLYVEDWMCNSDGVHFDMVSCHQDSILRNEEEIEAMEKMKLLDDCTDEIAKTIDEHMEKYKRFIGSSKKKIFEFKLKMNTMKQLHERKQQLVKEIARDKVINDGQQA